jgi:hypothetical protein
MNGVNRETRSTKETHSRRSRTRIRNACATSAAARPDRRAGHDVLQSTQQKVQNPNAEQARRLPSLDL